MTLVVAEIAVPFAGSAVADVLGSIAASTEVAVEAIGF